MNRCERYPEMCDNDGNVLHAYRNFFTSTQVTAKPDPWYATVLTSLVFAFAILGPLVIIGVAMVMSGS